MPPTTTVVDATDYGHLIDISGDAELAEDNHIGILSPGDNVSWQVRITNDEAKRLSMLTSAQVRVNLPAVLRYAGDAVLDADAIGDGATVVGEVDGDDVVFEIHAPGSSELTLTFSSVVREGITEVTWYQVGASHGEEGGGVIGGLHVLEASPVGHADTTVPLPPVPASGFYSFQVGPAEALSAGVVRSIRGILKLDPASEAATSEAAPGDDVVYGAMFETYAINGGLISVEVRITESPDVPFALSPDLSDVSGIEASGGDGLPVLITREPGVVIVRMAVPSAPASGAGISASVGVPGVVDPFARPGTVIPNIAVTATASSGEQLVPGASPVAGLFGLPIENNEIPFTITSGAPPTSTPPVTVITDEEYYATLLLSASTDDDESGTSPNFYVPVGDAVRWSAEVDTNSELLDESTPSKQFRVEDAVVRIGLDSDLVYNEDVTVVDERDRPVAVATEVVDGQLVIRVTGAVASRLLISFTTTVGEGVESIKRIAPTYSSGAGAVTPISHIEITSGRPVEDPDSRISLPPRAGYESYHFDIGPADPFETGVFDWRGWVVGFDGQQIVEAVRPGDQVMYAATGVVSTQDGGSTVVVRIAESPDAPFALSPDLSDHSGITAANAENEPVSTEIVREPGVVTVTLHLPQSDGSILNSSFSVAIPGIVDTATAADRIVPDILVNGRNASDAPLIRGEGQFGAYFPSTGIELPSLAPLPIIRD